MKWMLIMALLSVGCSTTAYEHLNEIDEVSMRGYEAEAALKRYADRMERMKEEGRNAEAKRICDAAIGQGFWCRWNETSAGK
jgi:hypothetical protein